MIWFVVSWRTFPAFIFLVTVAGSVKSQKTNDRNDEKGPLFLTPLIDSGKADSARELSKVDPTLFAGVNSHAAYITVNKTNKWHTFFWFFPVENKPLDSTPWLIWLQGGPGGSSLYGLFNEIGPLQCVTNTTASKMPVTWASDYSILYIDNPIGVGFSFSENDDKFVSTDEEAGICLLAFIEQFLQVFPELQKAPLFISGESYAGKYVPSFGYQIHQNKNTAVKIPLKGLIIADGFTDPPSLLHYSELGAQLGFLDFDTAKEFAEIEKNARILYNEGNMEEYTLAAHQALASLNYLTNVYNILYDHGGNTYTPNNDFLNMAEVQTALHVGKREYISINYDVYRHFSKVFFLSAKPWLEELLEHYPVLAYNGQLDFIVGYALSEHTYRSLNWTGSKDYLAAKRRRIASSNPSKTLNPIGYVKGAGNFMEVMIRAAGHMAPADQPLATKQVINMFIEKHI